MENQQEKRQEDMVKEAVEEAKKAAAEKTQEEDMNSDDCGNGAKDAEGADSAGGEKDAESTEGAGGAESEEGESEEGESEEGAGGKAAGKKLFGKKNKKDKKDEKIEELNDRLTRQMAEFDNFRKRTEKEKSQMYEIGAKDVIEKILPVVDNFERGLNAAKDSPQDDPFVQGMEMVYKQMMTALEGIGVKPIEAVGNEFDPEFHNAVMHVDDAELGENVVVEELQKGYLYRDSVVRYSMVKVAN